MIYNKDTALKVAEYLLQIKAIKLDSKNPFSWASGMISPIYCDNRKTLSYPKIRTYIRQQMSHLVIDKFGKPDYIVGVATGGIAQGILVAQDLGLPFAYTRSKAKEHGLNKLIEGDIESGKSAIVVEDLISTGKSCQAAVAALQEIGVNVKGVISIFDYGFDKTAKSFEKYNCTSIALSDYDHMLEKALEIGYIAEQDFELLKEWRKNPTEWNKNMKV